MTNFTTSGRALNILLRGLAIILFLLTGYLLNAQTRVGLPLSTYANQGSGIPLTPAIIVTDDETISPPTSITMNDGVKDWQILREDQSITDPTTQSTWLKFKGTRLGVDVSGDPYNDYKIELYVVTGQCAPRPTGISDCGTDCNSEPGYSTAAVRKCNSITVTAFGNTSTHSLCIYGDSPLVITPSGGVNFSGVEVGSTTTKSWSTNRTSNILWSVSPDKYLKFNPNVTNTQTVSLTYHPEATDNTTYTLSVSGNNPNLINQNTCDAPASASIPTSAADVPPAGARVDLIVVIDVSGSMGEKGECLPDDRGSYYDPANFDSKMGFVKSTLKGVYGKIKEIKPEANSRVGFITFSDNSKKEEIEAGKFWNKIEDDNESKINTFIQGLTPTYSTNMGAALNDAVSQLGSSNAPKKQIILITNGMQNGNIMVRQENNTPYIDRNDNRKYDSGEEIPADIQIFSIAIFQPSSEYLTLLGALAKNQSRFMDVCKLTEAMDEAFSKVYKDNSPKNVGYRRGNFSGGNATIDYNLTEKEFDRIIVSLSSMANTTTNFRFEKNVSGSWVDITAGGSKKQISPNYTLFSIQGLPKMVNGVNVTPQGQYRLVATSTQPTADYFTSAIVDDRGLKEMTFVESKTIRAGNTFRLSARVRYGVAPVHSSGVNIKAVIHRPVFSFEKLMADADVSKDKIVKNPWNQEKSSRLFHRLGLKPARGYTFEPNLPLIDQKFQVLVYDHSFLGKLKQETDTVLLSETTNGIYTANYSNTKVSGVYRVEYLINGNIPGTGEFFRTSSHSTPVLFGTPDRPKSHFSLFDDAGTYFLSLKPVDIYGNYLGMGKADQISMIMSTGSHSQPLDYLDGKYVIPLYVPANDNPYVEITIAGMEFYKGYLFDIPQDKWYFGIQAGMASPTGTFNNTADPGLMAALKLGYRLNRKLGILAEGGYFGFKDSTGNASNLRIIGGGAGLFFIPTSLPVAGGLQVQLESTIGYYKPKNLDGAWGIRAGLDLGKFFKTWLSFSLNGSYYTINTSPDKIQFIGTSLVAKFHF